MNTSALIQRVWNFCHTLRMDADTKGDLYKGLLQKNAEIIEHLEAALSAFREVAAALPRSGGASTA